MTLRSPAGTVALAAAVAAAALLAALSTYLAYAVHPLAGLAPVVVLAGAALLVQRPLAGVVIGLLAVPLEPFGLHLGGAAFSPTDITLFATAAAVLVRMLAGISPGSLHPAQRAFAALLVLIAVGYGVAEDPLPLTKLLLSWTAFLLVSLLVATAERRDLERVLLCIGLAGGIIGLVAVVGAGPQGLVSGGADATGRAQGSFQQPNVLGFFLVLCLPVAVAMSGRGGGLQRAALLASVGFAAAGIVLSLSRTSIVGAILSLLVLLAWPAFRRVAVGAIALILVVALFNVGAILDSQQVQVVGKRLGTLAQRRDVTENPRVRIYRATPAIIAEHPVLGVGEGNYSLAAGHRGLTDLDGRPYDHAHNVLLTVAAEVGLPGLGVLLVFIALVLLAARRALRAPPDRRLLALGLVAALAAIVPCGLGDYPLRPNVVVAVLMIEIGALLALARMAVPPGPEPR